MELGKVGGVYLRIGWRHIWVFRVLRRIFLDGRRLRDQPTAICMYCSVPLRRHRGGSFWSWSLWTARWQSHCSGERIRIHKAIEIIYPKGSSNGLAD